MPVSISMKGEWRWEHRTARKAQLHIRSMKGCSVVSRHIDRTLATSRSSPSGPRLRRYSEGKKPSSCPGYLPANNSNAPPPLNSFNGMSLWQGACSLASDYSCHWCRYFYSFSYERFLSRFFHTRGRRLNSSVRKQYLPVSPAGFFLPVIKLPLRSLSKQHG